MESARKKDNRKGSFVFRVGVVVLVVFIIWGGSILLRAPLLPEGKLAPLWSLTLVSNPEKQLSLEDLRGKIVVIDFWSISCPPCVRSLPGLEAVSRQMKGLGVVVVGIEAWGESAERIREFAKQKNVTYPLLMGTDSVILTYKATTLPTLYILDRQGRVAESHRGYISQEGLEKTIAGVLEH